MVPVRTISAVLLFGYAGLVSAANAASPRRAQAAAFCSLVMWEVAGSWVRQRHPPPPHNGRIALILAGESFRNSRKQYERGTCGGPSVEEDQIKASKSHMANLIGPLQAAGHEVRIFGATYPCSNGEQLVANVLPGLYGTQLAKLVSVVKSSNETGGQIVSMRNATGEALASEEQFDHYMVLRWDVVVPKPVDLECVLKESHRSPVAMHYAHIRGFSTAEGWGNFSMDFAFIVPSQMVHAFYELMRTDPEACCSRVYQGPACVPCMDRLNQIMSNSSGGEPETVAWMQQCKNHTVLELKKKAFAVNPKYA